MSRAVFGVSVKRHREGGVGHASCPCVLFPETGFASLPLGRRGRHCAGPAARHGVGYDLLVETGEGTLFQLLALFVVFLTEGARTAVKAKNAFGCYLAIGITAVVSVQVLVNAAVVSGSIPPTGLPLPFMSAGGSSLVAFLAATGLLANVSATDNGQTFSIKNKLRRKKRGESL